MLKLRVGLILWLVSWLPFAQGIITYAHDNGYWQSEKATSLARLIIWGIQILIGLIGLWLVGQLAVQAAKESGWKKAPGKLWKLFLHGPEDKTDPTD